MNNTIKQYLDKQKIKVVETYDFENKTAYIITAYYPDAKYFEDDLITRRK